MSPSRLELATRQPGIPRCLVVAETEHDQEGIALAVLLHDPTGVSPHWTLAAATCQELRRASDWRSRARALDQRLPELALDPDLVFAVVTLEGTTLTAWSLPAAALLVFQGGSMGELEGQGFAAVPAAESIRRGLERSGWRSGSIAVAPGMSFCLMPRAALARAGYRAFTTALAATPSSAVLAAVELAGSATPVIAGRLGALTAASRAIHDLGSARESGAARAPAAFEPVMSRTAPPVEPQLPGASRWERAAAAVARDRTPDRTPATIVDPGSGHAWTLPLPLAPSVPERETRSAPPPAHETAAVSENAVEAREAEMSSIPVSVTEAEEGALVIARRRSSRASESSTLSTTFSSLLDMLAALKNQGREVMGEAAGAKWRRSGAWGVLGISLLVTLTFFIFIGRLLIGPRPEGSAVNLDLSGVEKSASAIAGKGEEAPAPARITGASWTRRYPQGISSSPLLTADAVVFGGRDGTLRSLALLDGQERWKLEAGSGIGSSPALAGLLVIVGSYAGDLIAADAATGREAWRTRLGGKVVSSPAVTPAGLVVVGAHDQKVYGLAAESGEVRWQTATGGIVWASPVVDGEQVFVGSHDQHLYCLNAMDGRVVWRAPAGGTIAGAAALAGDRVMVGAMNGKVTAFDRESGKVAWTVKAGAPVAGGAVAAEDLVLIGTDAGDLLALQVSDGTRRYRVRAGGPIKCRPAVRENEIWFTSYDGALRVIDLQSGEERWRFAGKGQLYSSPAVLGRTAFFGSLSGTFYAATWVADLTQAATP